MPSKPKRRKRAPRSTRFNLTDVPTLPDDALKALSGVWGSLTADMEQRADAAIAEAMAAIRAKDLEQRGAYVDDVDEDWELDT